MNMTTRLNKILKASGITVEATWCNVVGSYTVWCDYHNGTEPRQLCLEGIARRTISRRTNQDDIAQTAALVIIDEILTFESR
jgi:hypothetical protein